MINKKEILSALKADLKSAELKKRNLDGVRMQWKNEYDGKPYGNEQKGKSEIVSRDIKKQSEWQHASLIDPFVSTPDIIKCSPVTFEDTFAAQQNELVLNTQFCRQFDRFNFMTKALKVCDQEGTVVVQTGWEYEDREEMVTVPDVGIDPMTGQQVIIGQHEELQRVIVKNQPTAKVRRNLDVYIDPTCQDNMDECNFVIVRYETSRSALKKDGRYKNLDKIDDSSGDVIHNPEDYINPDESRFEFKDEPRKKILVYEYWGYYDINGDGEVESIVCAWVENTIIRLEDNPYPDKELPFIVVPFNSVPFQMEGEAHAELLSDSQKVKTAILRGIIDNMAQSTNGQKGIKKGSLDSMNRKRFLNGMNFEFNGNKGDFFDGSYNEIPSSAFNMFSVVNNEIESMTGTKVFGGGLNGGSLGSSATAAKGVLDATATRRLNLVRNIAENLVKPLLRKWTAYNSEFLDDEQVFRITNTDFVDVKRDDLSGKIDIDIQVSTAEDNAAKAQELAFMLQTVGPKADPKVTNRLMGDIAKLYRMPDVAQWLYEYQPQPDPLMQEKAMLEVELLKAQVQNEYAKGAENQVDVQLKTAKTQNEMAKARAMNSDADLKDLNYVEQGSGVQHNRKMAEKEHDRLATLDVESLKSMQGGLAGSQINQPS